MIYTGLADRLTEFEERYVTLRDGNRIYRLGKITVPVAERLRKAYMEQLLEHINRYHCLDLGDGGIIWEIFDKACEEVEQDMKDDVQTFVKILTKQNDKAARGFTYAIEGKVRNRDLQDALELMDKDIVLDVRVREVPCE